MSQSPISEDDDKRVSPGRVKFLSQLQGACLLLSTALLLVDLYWLPAIITGVAALIEIALARRRRAAHICALINLFVSALAAVFHSWALAFLMRKHRAKQLLTERLFTSFAAGIVHLFALLLSLGALVAGSLCLHENHKLDNIDGNVSREESLIQIALANIPTNSRGFN